MPGEESGHTSSILQEVSAMTAQNFTKGNVAFDRSQTRENLMRAFAGESQARNRYTFAASQAQKEGLAAVAQVFTFTARQELAHAKVFYGFLKELSGQTLAVDGAYPVDLPPDTLGQLKAARHNEYQEFEHDYARFAQIAREEGFDLIASRFELIAQIEKTHGDRFGALADLLEEGRLFDSGEKTAWMCLNCGEIVTASLAPGQCPVCSHGQGYFIRLELAPFTRG